LLRNELFFCLSFCLFLFFSGEPLFLLDLLAFLSFLLLDSFPVCPLFAFLGEPSLPFLLGLAFLFFSLFPKFLLLFFLFPFPFHFTLAFFLLSFLLLLLFAQPLFLSSTL
jgi:hypothetical protein